MSRDEGTSQSHPEPELPEDLGSAPDPEAGVGGALIKARVRAGLFAEPRPAVYVDRFALLERMGAGGMGEVYSAFDPRLEREVAIKLLRPDPRARTAEARDRLVREARSLARVSHPNVVQVYEIGIAGEQLFVAMELIRGGTLEQRIPALREDWRALRDLFVAAGRGLEAAHRAGLVHRDFKPANVLIAKDGRIAVADFGLAKLMSEPSPAVPQRPPRHADLPPISADTRLTESHAFMGTPAYSSPEHVRGLTPNALSDQFSFCVALYEALHGTRPFAGEDAASRADAAQARRLEAGPGTKRLPAWLRAAVERGLAYAPEDRFPDMTALLSAITRDQRRKLHGRLARVLALGLVIGALASFGVMGGSSDPCAGAGAILDAVWNDTARARVEGAFLGLDQAYAGATWSRVRDLLDGYDAEWRRAQIAACEDTVVRHVQPAEVLAMRTACLGRGTQAFAALLAELSRADTGTLERAVAGVLSLPPPSACGDVEALLRGPRPPSGSASARRVEALRGALDEVRAAEVTGHRRRALERALELVEEAKTASYPPVEAEALATAGRLLALEQTESSDARAEELFWAGLDLAESHRDDLLAVDLWNELVTHASRREPTQERARLFARRAEAALARAGTPAAARITALANRARIDFRDRRLEASDGSLREALDALHAAADARPAVRLKRAELLHELANAVADQGRLEEAESLYEEALADLEVALGGEHPAVASLSSDFGLFLAENGRFGRAETVLRRALELWTAIHGPRHRNAGVCHLALANVEQARGRIAEAETHAREARGIYAETLPLGHPDQAEAASVLGVISFRRERFAEAEAAWRDALQIQTRALPADDPTIMLTRSNLAEARIELGDPTGALRIYQDLAPGAREKAGELPVLWALVLSGRGRARLAQGEAAAAEKELAEADRLWRDLAAYPLERADCLWAIARARRVLRRARAEASDPAEDAARIYEQHGRPEKGAAIRAWLQR